MHKSTPKDKREDGFEAVFSLRYPKSHSSDVIRKSSKDIFVEVASAPLHVNTAIPPLV